MPRHARIVIPGWPHHITQRGNNREDVFFVDEDRVFYLNTLRKLCAKHGVGLLGYCLMTNHVHLIATPTREDALNLAVGRTHFVYAQYVNRLHGRSGHLWQGRFYSCPMDEAHTVEAMSYVERNPVRAKLTRVPWSYRWSSAATHTGAPDSARLLDLAAWNVLATDLNWKDMLRSRDEAQTVTALRLNTQTGRPLASDSLLSKLECTLGRRLRPKPVGRPKKDAATAPTHQK
jgi:putative transposase